MKKNNLLAVMMLVSVFASIMFFQACNVSTANLSDVKLCTEKNSSNVCDASASTFPASTPVIYCSAILKNAPTGTKVTFEWKHQLVRLFQISQLAGQLNPEVIQLQ